MAKKFPYSKKSSPGKLSETQIEAARLWASREILHKDKLAEAVGVDRRTINRWFKKDYFVAAIYSSQKEIIAAMPTDIKLVGVKALKLLEEQANDPRCSEQARTIARGKLLDMLKNNDINLQVQTGPASVPVADVLAALTAMKKEKKKS